SRARAQASPGDAEVTLTNGLALALGQREPDQVDHGLGVDAGNQLDELGAVVADHDRVAGGQELIGVVHHQIGQMRHDRLDVRAVRAEQAGEIDVAVVDPDVVALADERFDELDDWALAQVVGAGLEAEAEHTDALAGLRLHELDPAAQLDLVALGHALQQRQLDVALPGRVEQRANVLRQARAAESEARAQIRGRDVQSRV